MFHNLTLTLLTGVFVFGPGTFSIHPESALGEKINTATPANSSSSSALYTVQESSDAATTVHKFVNSDGVIFAIVWSGIAQPDLEKIFGTYMAEYRAAYRAKRGHHRQNHKIQTPNIVVEHWGHMRDLHGRAYLPKIIPQGVKPGEIQ